MLMFFNSKHYPKAGDVGKCGDWTATSFTQQRHNPMEGMLKHRWWGPTPKVSNLVRPGEDPVICISKQLPKWHCCSWSRGHSWRSPAQAFQNDPSLCEFQFLSFLFSLALHLAWLLFLLREGAAHIRWRMTFMCRRLTNPPFPVKILFRDICILVFFILLLSFYSLGTVTLCQMTLSCFLIAVFVTFWVTPFTAIRITH